VGGYKSCREAAPGWVQELQGGSPCCCTQAAAAAAAAPRPPAVLPRLHRGVARLEDPSPCLFRAQNRGLGPVARCCQGHGLALLAPCLVLLAHLQRC
jgi:hypothetical protein